MKKPRKPREEVIHSDDEISDSEPMNAVDQFHQEVDYESESDADSETKQYGVADVDDRDDTDDDDEFEETEADNEYAAIPSRDAFGKNIKNYQGTTTEHKLRKMKKVERDEHKKLENEDANFRRDELHDFLDVEMPSDSDEESGEDEKPVTDVSLDDLTEEEKIKLLKRQSPLLFPLIDEYKLFSAELENVLSPLEDFLESADERFKTYVENRTSAVRAYLINIAFYFRLRAKASPNLEEHPVVDRLTKLRRIIERISSDKAQDYAAAYLDACKNSNVDSLRKVKETEKSEPDQEEEIEEDAEDDQPEEGDDGKRKITYKMDKNKGLRKKGQKKRANPRVKNRLAYESAKKRRKGQVREVKTETKKYTGEASGIRAGIKKSRRIKS